MEVKCETCGTVFDKPNGRVTRSKTGKHYCSKLCYQRNPVIFQKKTGREVECYACGKVFYRSLANIEKSKSGKNFCSKKCSAKYLSSLAKIKVCNYCDKEFTGGSSSKKYCSRDCWRMDIRSHGPSYYRKFKKDSCELCGFVPEDMCQLDVHHKDHNKKNNKEDNLQTLCANCHRLIHLKSL